MGRTAARWPTECLAIVLAAALPLARGDLYMINPRGSNNKMTEQNNNREEANRLFDSQNNAAAGFQVYDNCAPNCLSGNTYDPDAEGSQEGHLYHYKGSELLIEWTAQHGCGTPGKNTMCQMVIQYMCDSDVRPDKTVPGLRDGKDNNNNRRRVSGGDTTTPEGANEDDANAAERGRHEPWDHYDACRKRQRNKGLYTAGQNINNNRGASATRQNNNGNNRYGLECAEERDYYPYWHPSGWRDIAILTSEPRHCGYYREESQNVKAKGYCVKDLGEDPDPLLDPDEQVPNNRKACESDSGSWVEQEPWDIDPPYCGGLPDNRDNHHGNIGTGKMQSYLWTIPDGDEIVDGDRCVLRLRYNMTSNDFDQPSGVEDGADFDPFFDLDSSFNTNPPLGNDPKADFIGLGIQKSGVLQVQVAVNQFGRTFQDRSHTFIVRDRPDGVASDVRIVNYNVRGRRGNIVQVYPAVEYDFVPEDLEVNVGDLIHFQWGGSDANAQGNNGNGRAGTDRSNLVQISGRGVVKPIPIEEHTLFFDGTASADSEEGKEGRELVKKFAFLNQHAYAEKAGNACPTTVAEAQDQDDDDDDNCEQLNAAPAYFDGGLVEMRTSGEFHIASTRNNDYTNRSHKATIIVHGRVFRWWEVLLMVAGSVAAAFGIVMIGTAAYALMNPTTAAFSRRNRPLLLRSPCMRGIVERKGLERARFKETLQRVWEEHHDGKNKGTHKVGPSLPAMPSGYDLTFKNMDFSKIDQNQLKLDLVEALKKIGLKEDIVNQLNITFRKGSVIAGIKGPSQVVAALKPEKLKTLILNGEKPEVAVIKSTGKEQAEMTKPNKQALQGMTQENFEGKIQVRRRRCVFCGRMARRLRTMLTGDENGDGDYRAVIVFYLLQVWCTFMGAFLNWDGGMNRWFALAKAGGYVLDLNLTLLLIPTMRSVVRYTIQVRALDTLFNNDPIGFHIKVATWVGIGTFMHVLGHVVHAEAVLNGLRYQEQMQTTEKETISGMPFLELLFVFKRAGVLTGIFLTLVMGAMALTASQRVRRHTFKFGKCPRTLNEVIAWTLFGTAFALVSPFYVPYRMLAWGCRIVCCLGRGSSDPTQEKSASVGGFLIFWSFHKAWLPCYVVLLVHGPRCWTWFMFPIFMMLCDRWLASEKRGAQIMLKSAELMKKDVLKLQFSLPPGWVYQAGQYVQLCCDQVNSEEWHPFTLTSAPEEKDLSVAIRCPNDLDWCSALRRKLLEGPAKTMSGGVFKPGTGARITFHPYFASDLAVNSDEQDGNILLEDTDTVRLYSQPILLELFDKDGKVTQSFKGKPAEPPGPKRGMTSILSRKSKTSQLAKPAGDEEAAVAESVSLKKAETTTSLEEILRPAIPRDVIRLRCDGPHGAPSELVWKHKVVMLVGAGIGVTPFASILKSLQCQVKARQTKASKVSLGNSEIEDFDPCTSVHFYWLCRGQDEFTWFIDLLQEAMKGPAHDRIEVNLFQTAEVEISQVKVLGDGFRQFMGRPNWKRIFPKVAEQHPGEHIGAFLCGPQALRGELQRGAAFAESQDKNNTKFVVHAENF